MSSVINGFVIFSLFITLFYFIGVIIFITDHEENKCEMSHMFEYPQFVRISNEFDERYRKYGLYAYSEGRWTEKTRDMYFDGIPVLFVPGNAGSSKQVRSLASIALRKAINSRTPYHFDYFTVDLNDELSGLNGALLQEQLQYVNLSVYRVLELYKYRKNPPESVILFGHSMGGVIARRFVSTLPPDSQLVPIVLTLTSPHKRAPLVLDSYTEEFYREIDRTKSSVPLNTVFVSLSGGYNDFLVPTYLSELPANNNNSLNVVTTNVPLAWLTVDHVCILWCKQSILALNRALFESVDLKTKYISADAGHIKAVFHHHLVHNSGTKTYLRHTYLSQTPTNIRNDGEWIESLYRQYSVILNKGVQGTHWYMVRLAEHNPHHEMLTVVALNLEVVDWAFVCGAHAPRASGRVCEQFTHLSHLSEISPSARYKRRTLRLNMHQISKNDSTWTHVVVRVLPTSEPVVLHFDTYNSNERTLKVNLPNFFSLSKHVILDETAEKAISYELILPGLQHVIQSFRFYVDALKCGNEFNHATASLKVPWGNMDYHKHFTETATRSMLIRLYSSRPPSFSNQSAKIQLSLDPSCRYRISIQSAIFDSFGQMARFYSPLLLVNMAAVILMTLNAQLKAISRDGKCSMFFAAIKDGAKPYYILTSVKLFSRVLSISPQLNTIVAPDWLIISQEGIDFFLLPFLLYVCSVGLVWLFGIALGASLVLFETTVQKIVTKFLAKTVSFTFSWNDHVLKVLHKVPCIVAATLVFLSVATTGGLALFLGAIFYFMRLTQLSQDYIEELIWKFLKKLRAKFKKPQESGPQRDDNTNDDKKIDNQEENKSDKTTENDTLKKEEDSDHNLSTARRNEVTSEAHNAIFFHLILFMIWSVLALINLPSVLTWAHNFKYSTVLHPDPAFFSGFVLSLCAIPLWQMELPKVQRKWYEEVSHAVLFLAVISLIYAPISIYRLNYTLTACIVIITCHQVFGKDVEDLTSEIPSNSEFGAGNESEIERESDLSYDKIKKKWD